MRLYETVLGREGFRAGMDLYFKRHDGCAVTCDDFLAAMADSSGAGGEPGCARCGARRPAVHCAAVVLRLASLRTRLRLSHAQHLAACTRRPPQSFPLPGEDLSSLARWYGQAGTPALEVSGEYDADAQTYTVTMTQHTPPTKGQPDKCPVMIPVVTGLLGPDGKDLPFTARLG